MNRVIAIIILSVIAIFIFGSLSLNYGYPRPGVSEHYIEHGVAETGALNMVTAIYLNYRAYDTLGEAAVFFASALGVFMLLRKVGEEKLDG